MVRLNEHPTMAGLFFAMISQFAGKACTLSESGNLELTVNLDSNTDRFMKTFVLQDGNHLV